MYMHAYMHTKPEYNWHFQVQYRLEDVNIKTRAFTKEKNIQTHDKNAQTHDVNIQTHASSPFCNIE